MAQALGPFPLCTLEPSPVADRSASAALRLRRSFVTPSRAMESASESKRCRSDEAAAAAASDAAPVSRSELEEMLAQAEASIAADSSTAVQTMEKSITNNFSTRIRAVDSANQKRFGSIDTELQTLRQHMDDSENANIAMFTQLG